LGIPLLTGRSFTAMDTTNAPYVLIVNQAFVHKYFGERQPLGQLVQVLPEPRYPARTYQVFGTIANTKYSNVREETPPDGLRADRSVSRDRAGGRACNDDRLQGCVRNSRSDSTHDRDQASRMILQFFNFQQGIRDNLVGERMMAMLSGFFGLLAALLVVIGLYGVLSYFVTQRKNEIGIRIALGANRRRVIGLVLRDTASMLAIGVVLGTVLACVAGRAATTLLFGLKPYDAATLGFSVLLLTAIAVLASLLPAFKASRLDPVVALRSE
jgi:hypothetical protein